MLTSHDEMKYQINLLLAELEELQSKSSKQIFWSRTKDGMPANAATTLDQLRNYAVLRVKEAYWTITRWIGLAHLHDGSAPLPERRREAELERRPWLGRLVAAPDGQPRVFLDLTATFLADGKSGIQRVARNLAKHIVDIPGCMPVIMDGDVLRPYFRGAWSEDTIALQPGDTIVFCDLTPPSLMRQTALNARRNGAFVSTIVYDLIPALQPGFCHPFIIRHFKEWFSTAVAISDQILTISNTVASQIEAYLTIHPSRPRRDLRIDWFHLGAELDEQVEAAKLPEVVAAGADFFLIVGTLEPRKGHSVALDAFEHLWADGCDATLVIAGRYGWNSDHLLRRICEHPEYGRRLVWIDQPPDTALRHLYENARALIMPSLSEGFGLPLVEAGSYGTPVIASDLPVFREICGDDAQYFPTLDALRLGDEVKQALAGATVPPNFDVATWDRVANNLIERVRLLARSSRAPNAPPSFNAPSGLIRGESAFALGLSAA